MGESSKTVKYEQVLIQVKALIDPNCAWLGNYANICALIHTTFNHLWSGFYFVNQNQQLEIGPFQGPVACTIIPYNKGVCGSSWAKKETIIVPDVHQFKGHIACSSESNSEIVVPIIQNNHVIGVLDIDSIHLGSFDEIDRHYLEKIVELLPEFYEMPKSYN